MKKITVLLLSALLLATACKEEKGKKDDKGDSKTEKPLDPEAAFDLKLYKRALEIGDAYTAISALNSFLLRDSSKIEYKDTLLQLYLQTQQLMASYTVSSDLLKHRPNDTTMLQINVSSAYELGAMDLAIGSTKKLLDIDPENLALKFQYGQSLIQTGKTDEGIKVVEEVMNNPKASKGKVPYAAFENGRQVQKELKLNLAAAMLLGQYYAQANNLDKSEAYFRQALKIDPNFKPAAEAVLQIKNIQKGIIK